MFSLATKQHSIDVAQSAANNYRIWTVVLKLKRGKPKLVVDNQRHLPRNLASINWG